jgi:DNA-binding FadR family transcriptional regulator
MALAPARPPAGPVNDRTRRRKYSEDIALSIVQYITEEGLEPGSVLPNEAKMGEMLGVGRTTLREALRLLETQGVLTIKAGPRGGPVVRAPRPDDLKGAMTLLLQFHQASFETLMHARVVIEPAVAAAAAKRITKAQIHKLEQNLSAMDAERPVGKEKWLQSNEDFHVMIAAAAGNPMLHMVVATMVAVFTSQRLGVYEENRRLGVSNDHRAVIDALSARDADAAEEAMRRHLKEAYTFFQKRYPDLMQQPVRWSG